MSFLNCTSSGERNYRDPSDKARPIDRNKLAYCDKMSRVGGAQMDTKADKYDIIILIGKGHMNRSVISLATHVDSGTHVAVKRVDLEKQDKNLSLLQTEIGLTQQLNHKHILPILCAFTHQQQLWIISPLMEFGSCQDLIQAYFNAGLREQAILFILRDVVSALDYIHQQGIIHRAIKGSHVLISKSGHTCLTGFQHAYNMVQNGRRRSRIHKLPVDAIECLHCYSPEMLEQNLGGYDSKSDMYSLGILTCELANGQSPFADMPPTQMLLEKLGGVNPKLADNTTVGEFIVDEGEESGEVAGTPQERAETIFFQRSFSKHLHSFTAQCLERDPNHRPTAEELLSHPVFKSIKTKSSSCLPSFLDPINPLTEIAKASGNQGGEGTKEELDVSRQLSQISMQEEWVF